MENLQSSKIKDGSKFKCNICDGTGEVDVGWYFCVIEKCKNCGGTGCCDWIRNIMPIYNKAK